MIDMKMKESVKLLAQAVKAADEYYGDDLQTLMDLAADLHIAAGLVAQDFADLNAPKGTGRDY